MNHNMKFKLMQNVSSELNFSMLHCTRQLRALKLFFI